MALFIIDFDYTIINTNMHNLLCQAEANNMESQWNIIKQIPPVGDVGAWRAAFKTLFADQHQIAIASFNSFGYLIPLYLKNIIGLSEEEVNLVHVEAWLPTNYKTSDKNQHIDLIKKDLKFTGQPTSIVLVDDDLKNINKAKELGYRTITATGNHPIQIIKLSQELSASNSNFTLFNNSRRTLLTENQDYQSKQCVIN